MINESNETISSIYEMAELLGKSFAKNSSDNNYSKKFLDFKNKMESEQSWSDFMNINEIPWSHCPVNRGFLIQELSTAIDTCKSNAPGPDGIPLALLKNLSP